MQKLILYSDSDKKGKIAENIFTKFLEDKNVKWQRSPLQQKADYDFKTKYCTYEIKYQSFPDTICLEDMYDIDNNILGWTFVTKAKYLIEVDIANELLSRYNMSELLRLYKLIRKNYDIVIQKNYGQYGDVWYSSHRKVEINQLKQYLDIKTTSYNNEDILVI
jgi:hypothetical protein